MLSRNLRIRSPVGTSGFSMAGGDVNPAGSATTPVRGKSLSEDVADTRISDADDPVMHERYLAFRNLFPHVSKEDFIKLNRKNT